MSRSSMVIAVAAFGCYLATPLRSEQVTAYLLDGTKIDGRITDCAEASLTIESPSGSKALFFSNLDRVDFPERQNAKPIVSLEQATVAKLVDGSSIVCQAFVGRDDHWTALSTKGTPLDFPKGSVESLLLASPSAALKDEWLEAAAEVRTSDEMVVARQSGAVDRASGMIVGITPESVEFSFDGQVLQAPRSKLMGLLWFRSQERRVEPAIQVKLRDGSRWEAVQLSMIDRSVAPMVDGLKWTTPSGVEAMETWSEIQEVNFSAANVVWLAAQTPLSQKTFQRKWLNETIAGREEMLGPRFSSADGSQNAKSQDLNFMGPGEIAFRIPQGFHRFVAKLRRFEKTRFATAVLCQVWVGDDLAWSTALANDQFELEVEVPVVPEKKLRIVVECESDLLLGTQLSWQQPRLIR